MTSLSYTKPFLPHTPEGQGVTKVVRLRKYKNQTYQNCDVYVGDAVKNSQWNLPKSPWSNPYKRGNQEDLKKYKEYVLSNQNLNIDSLRGKRLGHFCKPRPCHAQVLADIVRARDIQERVDLKKADSQCHRFDNILKTGDRMVYYKGKDFLFCPSYQVGCCYQGYFFTSAVHAFHYARALQVNDEGLANRILYCKNTNKAVKLGESIKLNLQTEVELMLTITRLKYDQVAEVVKEGRSYLYSILADASQNKKWGLGVEREVTSFRDHEGLADFPGENIMGWINKYVISRKLLGEKGVHYLERLVAHADRTGQSCPATVGLKRVLRAGVDVWPLLC